MLFPKRYLVHRDVKRAFTETVLDRVAKLTRGDPADPASDISCRIRERAAKEMEEQVKLTIREGVSVSFDEVTQIKTIVLKNPGGVGRRNAGEACLGPADHGFPDLMLCAAGIIMGNRFQRRFSL